MRTDIKYVSHIKHIHENGYVVKARGLTFKEIISMPYVVPMRQPVINRPLRNIGYRFAAAEAHWILSGSNLLSEIDPYGGMARFSDDGFFMKGAYGPKIVDQFPYVMKTLSDDPGSRQAVINIWRESPGPSKDIPCTLSLQFLIRDGVLNTVATMRSSDAVLGLPYDSITFSLVSAMLISLLKQTNPGIVLELGNLHMNLGSAHFYEDDYELCAKIANGFIPVGHDLDFQHFADAKPKEIMNALEGMMVDKDGSGILEMDRIK